MKVGIDTLGCEHARSGLGSYLFSLVNNLSDDENTSYELFGIEADKYTYSTDKAIPFTSVKLNDSLTAQKRWHLFCANRFIKRQGYDVVLFTAASKMLPVSFSVPSVALVNDCLSDILNARNAFFSRIQILRGLKYVTKIIASSQFIKKDLVKLGIDSQKIVVIYNGIDHSQFYQHSLLDSDTVTIKPFAIKRPYLIYGTRLSGPSKKHVELVQAFTRFKEKTHLPHRLVLTGVEDSYAKEVSKAVAKSSAVSDIFMTGYFPKETYPELYSGADACIFPSVCEGVGLPIIEAMATGIPVACSRAGVLPEVAGDNAVYFDANSIEDMADGIERIVTDTALREKLIADGVEWTKRFQWKKTAQMTADVLKSVVQMRS
ncbi:MAG: glycosyltransferase family 4 protein [Treponema sp.]|nr:glycosyltransferase family 4 protein [Treponema sp.]